MTTNDEPTIPEYVLKHYWGEPWVSRGIYPEWSRYTDEQQQEIRDLQALIAEAVLAARIESLQWALNDYNMPDTDTPKNLQGFIDDLEERQKEAQKESGELVTRYERGEPDQYSVDGGETWFTKEAQKGSEP